MHPSRLPRNWHLTLELDKLARVTRLADAELMLDLGAGSGCHVARQLLARHPALRIVALEARPLSPTPHPRLHPLRADAREIPLAARSVDLAYARFLLQHLPEPLSALRGMARVTRPGGQVAALEVDEGSILLHPLPPRERERVEAHARGLKKQGKDRFLGRRLKHLLRQAGLRRVGVHALTVTSEQVGMASFWSIVMTRRGHPAAPLPAWARSPDAFGCIVLYLGHGEVP